MVFEDFLEPDEQVVAFEETRELGSLPPLIGSLYRSLEVSPARDLPKRLIVAVTTQRFLVFDSGSALDGRPQRIVDEAALSDVSDVESRSPWYSGTTVTWKAHGSTYRLKARVTRGPEIAKALQPPAGSGST